MTTNSKLGGTRIPFEKVVDELPPLKIHELVALHRDGSVRYFSIGEYAIDEVKADPEVVAIIYNGVSGPTLPIVEVSDLFVFDSTFLKCMKCLRLLLARYVKRSFFEVSVYRVSDGTTTSVGIYKLIFAVELALRSVL